MREIQKKNRVTVACNRCRRSKRRCDGKMRCQNCIASNADCQYERQERKPSLKIDRPQKQDKVMAYMSARLDKLETILLKLAEKVCDLDKESFASLSGISGNPVAELNFESEDEQLSTLDSAIETQDPTEVSPQKRAPLEQLIKYGDLYLGSHSFFSIFSKSSLAWMSEQLGEGALHLIIPLTNLPALFQKITKNLFKRWIASPNLTHAEKFRVLKKPITQSKEFISDLFEKHAPTFSCINTFFTHEKFYDFIDRYYDEADTNFDISELFKFTIVILFCLSRAIDVKLSSTETPPDPNMSPEGEHSMKSLMSMRDNYLSNCFYYIHQLTLLGSSLECLQAFLFFILYMDTHVHSPEIVYLVLVLAASKARDLGLHRIETYDNPDDPATQLRVSLWCLVCYIDMEICFRTGKTPLINYQDVSPEIRQHYNLATVAPPGSAEAEFHKWHSFLFDIRLESYNRLFSAYANIHSFEVLLSNLDFFNSEMANLSMSMTGDRRPLFFNEPGFTQIYGIDSETDELRARSLLTYFVHTMLMNRIPSMTAFPDIYTEKCRHYRNLSLNSARTILYLLKDFDNKKRGPFPLWMFYLPVSAILHLLAACMADPGTPDAASDVSLISETCKRHFNRINSRYRFVASEFEISVLLELMVKSMLKIVIRIYENKTGKTFFKEDDSFKGSLDQVQKLFPRLFQAPKDLESLLGSHFQGKSPFPGGNKGSLTSSPSTSSDRSLLGRGYQNLSEFNSSNPDILDPSNFLNQFDEVDFFFQSQNDPNPNFFASAL